MKDRIFTGFVLVFMVVVLFSAKLVLDFGDVFFDVFICLLAVLSAYEIVGILRNMNMFNHKYLVIAYPIFLFAIVFLSLKLNWLIVALISICSGSLLLFFGISLIWSLIFKNSSYNEIRVRKLDIGLLKFSTKKALNTVVGCFYPSFLFVFLFLLNQTAFMQKLVSIDEFNYMLLSVFVLAFAFLIPAICDTFAYFTGMLIGGKKLCPNISPKKTISGAIGGIVWTVLIVFALFELVISATEIGVIVDLLEIQIWQILLFSFLGAVACEAGDLCESFLKRKAGIKDSSNLLPGHGGILDRFDGQLFSNIVVMIFLIVIVL